MQARVTDKGVSVELSCGEAMALLEQLGDVPARGRPKLRQMHRLLEVALDCRATGERARARDAAGAQR